MNCNEIKACPIVGNAFSDGKLLNAIHLFLMNPKNSMSEKIQVMTKLDETIGEPQAAVTEADVLQYIAVESE